MSHIFPKVFLSATLALSLGFEGLAHAAASQAKTEKLETIYDSAENRTKLVEEMLELTDAKKMIEDNLGNAAQMILKDNTDPEKKKAVEALFKKYFSWEKMAPEFTKIYTEVYTIEDLQRINQFYKSDVGQRMLEKTPELMVKTMEVIQKMNQENMPKMVPELMKILPPPAAPAK